MAVWKLSEITKAVNGQLVNAPQEDLLIQGIQPDSRQIKEGFLFVPLIAERNGHDFVDQAYQAGALASFWSEDLDKAPKDLPLIIVEDTLQALQETARWYLQKIQAKVVAITGSNGKTTTKDMTAKVLERKYKTHKTAGNFNNHIGLPLTLLTMPADTEIVVLEMGTSNPGEIEVLSKLAKPDTAVVTMIGESHIEAFGTRENLAKEKVSIAKFLKQDGLFIYPMEEELIANQLPKKCRHKNFSIKGKSADLSAKNIVEKINSTEFTVTTKENTRAIAMEIPVPGQYNVNNALIALLIGLEYGISLEEGKEQLANLELTKDRLEWLEGIKGWSLLNDAYNASPSSMRAVLSYFQGIETKEKKVLVLGDILELGDLSRDLHASLADAINLRSYDFVYLYGPAMQSLYEELTKKTENEKVFHFKEGKADLLHSLRENVVEGSYLLFKSSNGTNLLSLVEELRIKND